MSPNPLIPWHAGQSQMVEAVGIEPTSEDPRPKAATPIVRYFGSRPARLPRTGSVSGQPVRSRVAVPRPVRDASQRIYDIRPRPPLAWDGRTSPLVRRRVLALCRQL